MRHMRRFGYIKMVEWLNQTVQKFESDFARKAAFQWFVVVILRLMVRSDHLGVTSIIRELAVDPKLYNCLIHFFHADSWKLASIQSSWISIVKHSVVLYKERQMPILVIDGVKTGKEARKMPCVKKHHQESENSSKAEYIFGHLFGAVGVLAGSTAKLFCIPVSAMIQDGVSTIRKWENPSHTDSTHVVQMIKDACNVAAKLGHSILLADRYFLSRPALEEWVACEKQFGAKLLSMVMKAKKSTSAYELPKPKSGKGRPARKGNKVKLQTYFNDLSTFSEASICLYGKTETVKYLCKDLLWGDGLYHMLRFVLVQIGDTQAILACTDLSFLPEQIIRLYSYRFKIEVSFRSLKQTIAGFSYHFWTTAMPKLNKYRKSNDVDPLESITGQDEKAKIISSLNAIEGFVFFSCIALGLLQIMAYLFRVELSASPLRWLRTKSNSVPSEATVADFLRKSIFKGFHKYKHLLIVRIIHSKQFDPHIPSDFHIA